MTQPIQYIPQHDYSKELGTAHGTHLDEEFADIATTTDEIRSNLGLIQRDDGRLKNGSVHANAFDASALALIASDWKPRGAWLTATAYAVGDVVEQGSSGYVCAAAHISGTFATDHTGGYWVLFANDSALRGDLAASSGSSLVGFIADGTGAVARPVEDDLRDRVSVFQFMTPAQIADVRARTFSIDVTAALNKAFAQTGKIVYAPDGSYRIGSNLDRPTCRGIVGEGWNNGTAGVTGTWFGFVAGVTTGLDLYGDYCPILRDFGMSGNATANAVGLRIGDRTSAPYTWDYGQIQNVRVSGFTGTGAIGMYLRNANFCSFPGVFLDNNTRDLVCELADAAAGTVPADCWFHDLKASSTTDEAIAIYSGGNLNFINPRISGAGKEAVVIDPAAGAVGTHSATGIRFKNPAFENISNADVTRWQIRCKGSAAQNAVDVLVEDINLEAGAADPRFIKTDGAYCNAVVVRPGYAGGGTPSPANLNWIYADNKSRIVIRGWFDKSSPSVAIAPVMSNATVANEGIIEGDGVWMPFTMDFDSTLTVVLGGGSVAYAAFANRVGNVVHWYASIKPAGGATVASTGGGATHFVVDAAEPDIGQPYAGQLSPFWVSSDDLSDLATAPGLVGKSGARFIAYTPAWAATSKAVYMSGSFVCALVNIP